MLISELLTLESLMNLQTLYASGTSVTLPFLSNP